jgi:hypothetical protein
VTVLAGHRTEIGAGAFIKAQFWNVAPWCGSASERYGDRTNARTRRL